VSNQTTFKPNLTTFKPNVITFAADDALRDSNMVMWAGEQGISDVTEAIFVINVVTFAAIQGLSTTLEVTVRIQAHHDRMFLKRP